MRFSLRGDSRGKLFSLAHKRQEPGGWFVVGRRGTSDYLDVSRVGFEIILLLKKGKTIAEAERAVRRKFGEDYDVKGFVSKLASNGMVEKVDGKPLPVSKESFTDLSSRIPLKREKIGFLFSKRALFACLLVLGAGASVVASDFSYFLNFRNFIFTDSLALLLLSSLVSSWILVALHELAHYAAGLHFGAKPKFGLTVRLQYVIAFTELSDLYLLERWKRYAVFLSGMVFDGLVLSIAASLVWAGGAGVLALPLWLVKFLKFVVLMEIFGLVWQTMLFLRTDLYYVLENLWGIEDLHGESLRNLRFVASHLSGGRPFHSVFKTEIKKRYILFYNAVLTIGLAANVLMLILYELPITIFLFYLSLTRLYASLNSRVFLEYLDSAVFLFVFVFNFLVLFVAFLESRPSSRRGLKHLFVSCRGLVQPLYALGWKHHVQRFLDDCKRQDDGVGGQDGKR